MHKCVYTRVARECVRVSELIQTNIGFLSVVCFLGGTILRYRSTMVSRVCAIAGACSGVPFSPGLCLRGPHCVSMFI